MKKLLLLLLLALPLLAGAQTKIYLNFNSHNEADGTDPDYSVDSNYTKYYNYVLRLSDSVISKGAKYNFQSDFKFLLGCLNHDPHSTSTGGTNLIAWMNNSPYIEADPHCHEGNYNYADIAHLHDSLIGIRNRTVIGGIDPYSSRWMEMQDSIAGHHWPLYKWKPNIIWGFASPGHGFNDTHYGVWRPKDSINFYTDESTNHLRYIGSGCEKVVFTGSTAHGIMDTLRTLINKLHDHTADTNGFYTATIMFNVRDFSDDFLTKVISIIDSVHPYVLSGDVVWATHQEKDSIWAATYSSRAFKWGCDETLAGIIYGTTTACVGTTTNLYDSTTGGVWTSSDTSKATVNSSGVVTGVGIGTSIISYSLSGYVSTALVTVNSAVTISGTTASCNSSNPVLTTSVRLGNWSSSNSNIAIGTTSGIITHTAIGTSIITYSVAGCIATTTVAIVNSPSVITGPSSVCTGTTIQLSDSISSGSWSSSNTSKATVSLIPGVVTGVAAGSTNITYTLLGGCFVTKNITVNTSPIQTTATTAALCVGATSNYTYSLTGGVLTSSNPSVAAFSSSTLRGVSAGTTIISYVITSSGCSSVQNVTVYPVPTSISGSPSICAGTQTTLTGDVIGGTWSSSSTSVATINATNGLLSGVASGTTIITYTMGLNCKTTRMITVLASPTAMSGSGAVCSGSSTTYSSTTTGTGTWSSSNTGIASVNSSGSVTGVSTGSAIISFTNDNGCYTTLPIIVNTTPVATSSAATICSGTTTIYSFYPSGGTYSSSNTSIAAVGTSSGTVSGIGAGNAIITYTLAGGCYATLMVTVNASPSAITGATSVCQGQSTLLTITSGTGTWSSSDATVSVGASSGIVTGINAGTATIYFTSSTGCTTSTIVTVGSLGSITGPASVCVGQSITDSNSSSGGIWSTTYTSIISVGSGSGIITGLANGLATVTYTLGSGCSAISTITVNALSAISGPGSVCQGQSISLSNTTGGGSWSTSATTVSVGGSSGIVYGIAPGTATISYSLASGCSTTTITTINGISSITGSASVCVGQTITLGDTTTGGSWSSSSPTIATIGSATGILSGIAGGLTTNISYTLSNGCYVTYTVSVNSLSPISGPSSVCQGQTITLSETFLTGTWSSIDASVTVGGSTGVINGVSSGTASITFTASSGCQATTIITVNAILPITGPTSVCNGQSITLSDLTGGGSWSSAAPTIASVGSSTGVVTGLGPNYSTIIYYTLPSGCSTSYTVSVNPISAISGTSPLCQGSTTNYSDGTTGGIWTGSNAVMNINPTSGLVTGLSGGTAIITYTLGTGCTITTTLVVNPISPIAGSTSVCAGQTMTLTDATPGGTWSCTSTVATVAGSTGVVTGVSGTYATNISYTMPSGCSAYYTITVNALSAITGATSVCPTMSISLNDLSTGGKWFSSAISVATVGSTSGIVQGVTAGTSIISYLMPSGCLATQVITVGVLASITGPSSVCVGQSVSLADATPGGTWSSASSTIAIVGSTGIVTGVAGNLSTTITYALSASCRATKTISVYPLQAINISTTIPICVGNSVTATDGLTGGTWSSANTSIATIGTTGAITGVASGTTVISYVLSTGCTAQATVTVNALAPITGPGSVCWHSSITLSDAISGGTWTSSAPTIASLGTSTGVVTGNAASLTANITYTLSTGCKAFTTISVNPVPSAPAAITGPSSVSVSGATITLNDATTGGIWTSSNTSFATVGATGIVTGVSVGSATITYTVSNTYGCTSYASKNISVGPVAPSHAVTINSDANITVGISQQLPNTNTIWELLTGEDNIRLNVENGTIIGIAQGTALRRNVTTIGYETTINILNVTVNPAKENGMAGINEASLVISPNPNNGSFTLSGNPGETFTNEATMQIVDMTGRVIYYSKINSINGNLNEHVTLNNEVSAGLYLIKISAGSGEHSLRFVIEK